jgi:GH15 family glucan-1,4-alpha-glucosidase
VPAAIRDHAFLSDCRTAALVTRDGAVDWWPAPRFDSPSAFSALLDDEAGHWSLRPRDRFDATWRYRPGTLVLETTMRTANGTLQVTDALAFAPGARGHEIGREAPHALVRVAEALEGTVAVEVDRTAQSTDAAENVQDALRQFGPDEIVVVTGSGGDDTWLEEEAVREALAAPGVPVRRIEG